MASKITTRHPHKEEGFQGYSIGQLRYQLALTLLDKEVCREKLVSKTRQTIDNIPFVGKAKEAGSRLAGSSLLPKVFRSLNYADYFMMGLTAFKSIKSITSLFRRKKK